MDADDADNNYVGEITRQRHITGRTPAEAEFEEALRHCEQLLRGVDGGLRRIAVARAISMGLVAVVILAVVLFAVASQASARALDASVVVAVAIIVVIVVLSQRLVIQLREQLRRDELIMVDIIGMQREILPLLAREEKWSSARLFLTQKRLERFPIEAESVSKRHSRYDRR